MSIIDRLIIILIKQRQKRIITAEQVVTTKERDELAEKAKTLESILQKKERDITDLLIKVNDTINDYESKLEKKEEQMWTMSIQMSEETNKQKQSNIPGETKMPDSEFMNEVEKKWQEKELALTAENERILGQARDRDDTIRCIPFSHSNTPQP